MPAVAAVVEVLLVVLFASTLAMAAVTVVHRVIDQARGQAPG